jgi:hypothetical protein
MTPKQLQYIYDEGYETELDVTTWQERRYVRLTGLFGGTVDSEHFLLLADGDEWTVCFSEIVRTY